MTLFSCQQKEPEQQTILVMSVSVDPTEITIKDNESAKLTATVLPEDATNKKISWSSENEDIAKVSGSGLVSGVSEGETDISVITDDGELTAKCHVTVLSTAIKATGLTLDQSDASLYIGGSPLTLIATVLPAETTNKGLTWTSSDEKVATVSASGTVTAVAVGRVVITAMTTDGTALKAKCTVSVYDDQPFQMRLLTFNILQGGKSDGSLDQEGHEWNTVRRAPCMNMIKDKNPDIIFLQECRKEQLNHFKSDITGYTFFSYAKDGALASGFKDGDATNDNSFANKGQRNVTMLRTGMFEMIEWGRFWLSETPDVPSAGFGAPGAQKVTLWLKVRHLSSGFEFYLFNTHFIPSSYVSTWDPPKNVVEGSAEVNMQQLKLILGDDTVSGKGTNPETVLFAGDLNTNNMSEALASVNDYLYHAGVDAPETDWPLGTYNGWRSDPSTWYLLDHIYYKNATPKVYKVVTEQTYGTPYLSDHNAVYCDFILNDKPR